MDPDFVMNETLCEARISAKLGERRKSGGDVQGDAAQAIASDEI